MSWKVNVEKGTRCCCGKRVCVRFLGDWQMKEQREAPVQAWCITRRTFGEGLEGEPFVVVVDRGKSALLPKSAETWLFPGGDFLCEDGGGPRSVVRWCLEGWD